jgi:hypothetical protein
VSATYELGFDVGRVAVYPLLDGLQVLLPTLVLFAVLLHGGVDVGVVQPFQSLRLRLLERVLLVQRVLQVLLDLQFLELLLLLQTLDLLSPSNCPFPLQGGPSLCLLLRCFPLGKGVLPLLVQTLPPLVLLRVLPHGSLQNVQFLPALLSLLRELLLLLALDLFVQVAALLLLLELGLLVLLDHFGSVVVALQLLVDVPGWQVGVHLEIAPGVRGVFGHDGPALRVQLHASAPSQHIRELVLRRHCLGLGSWLQSYLA